MANDFYTVSGSPSTGSSGSSSVMRGEFALIAAGFDKLPTLTANGGEWLRINAGATAIESLSVADAQTALGVMTSAAQSDQEAATSTALAVTPGRQQFHPSAAKGWVFANTVGAIGVSYNVASISDVAVGRLSVTWDVDFSTSIYPCFATAQSDFPQVMTVYSSGGQFAGAVAFICQDSAGTDVDPDNWNIVAFGDQ